jgi:hypothetical protein
MTNWLSLCRIQSFSSKRDRQEPCERPFADISVNDHFPYTYGVAHQTFRETPPKKHNKTRMTME